jgi:hypothetical protein
MGSNAFNQKKKKKNKKKKRKKKKIPWGGSSHPLWLATPKWLNGCGRQDSWCGSANPLKKITNKLIIEIMDGHFSIWVLDLLFFWLMVCVIQSFRLKLSWCSKLM